MVTASALAETSVPTMVCGSVLAAIVDEHLPSSAARSKPAQIDSCVLQANIVLKL